MVLKSRFCSDQLVILYKFLVRDAYDMADEHKAAWKYA